MSNWNKYDEKKPKRLGRYLVAYKHLATDNPWYEVLEYRKITRLDWELPKREGQTIFVDYNEDMYAIDMNDRVEYWQEIEDPV